MENDSHILIGSRLQQAIGNRGTYAVQFMGATLTFDNGSFAVNAYNNIEGEAYLWDLSVNKKVILIEAKLLKQYRWYN